MEFEINTEVKKKMAHDMRAVKATHRQMCAMAGCGAKTYMYYTRRSNPAGAMWICDDCIKSLAILAGVELPAQAEEEAPAKAEKAVKEAPAKGKRK